MVVVNNCDSLTDWTTVNGGDALDTADKQEGTASIVVVGAGAAVEIEQEYDPGVWDWSTYDHFTFWFKTDTLVASDLKLRIWSGANPANNYLQWNRQFLQQVRAVDTWYQVKLYLDDYDTSVGAINLAAVTALRFYVLDTVGVVTFKLDYIRIDLPDPVKIKIGTAANLDYVSDHCLELDLWRDSLSGIGRWQVILENPANMWGGRFIPDEDIELRIDGVLMMRGYVDDVVPFLAPGGHYKNHIKVLGRDRGMDLVQLYLTAPYAQDNADDIVDLALAAVTSEIDYTTLGAAPVIDFEFNRTYLADGIRDICKLVDYDFYVDDTDPDGVGPFRASLHFFDVGAVGQHTAVNLTAVAAAATNNILKLEKGEKIGADIKNYLEAHAGGLQDHYTDLNASDWDATAAAACALTDETTIYLAGKGAIRATATGATDLIADLDFTGTLYEYATLDMSDRNEGSYLGWVNYPSDAILMKALRIRLKDNADNWIEFYKSKGISACPECTDNNINSPVTNAWRKVVFPYGEGIEIHATGTYISDFWQYVGVPPAPPFDWSNVETIRFTSDPLFPRAVPDYFIIDGLDIPTVEVISIEQDAGSQASYGVRMLPIYRPDIKNQVELDEFTLTEEDKQIYPLETIKITASGQTGSVYAGQSLDVQAPSHGIAALTKYRIMKLHHQVRKTSEESPVQGYIFLTDYDLVKDEINPTQVIDPIRFARYKTPIEATVRDMRDKLIRLTKLDPASTSGGAGGSSGTGSTVPYYISGADIVWYDTGPAYAMLRPETTGAIDLGSNAIRWGNVYADDLYGIIHDVHSRALQDDVTREIFYPYYNDTHANATLRQQSKGSVINLPDAVTTDVYLTIRVPDDFVSFTKIEIVWITPAAAGNMYGYLRADYGAGGEDYQNHQDLAAVSVLGVNGGANIRNVTEPAIPLTLANLATGDYVDIVVHRTGGDVLDTIGNDVRVYGILFTYTADH